jgi:hypothetical protein
MQLFLKFASGTVQKAASSIERRAFEFRLLSNSEPDRRSSELLARFISGRVQWAKRAVK